MKNINKFICGMGVACIGLTAFTSCEEETHPTSYATTDQMAQSSSATEALLSAVRLRSTLFGIPLPTIHGATARS